MSNMKTNRPKLIMALLALILTINTAFAGEDSNLPKTGTIAGRVLDAATLKPMEYVNVAVYRIADSSLLTGSITNPEGSFSIGKLSFGDYYLKISFLGFNEYKTGKVAIDQASPLSNLGDIKLTASQYDLGAVSVTAEKSKVEYQIDKRVINVDQQTVAKGGSAVNVLENTPSVQVDPQGNLTLRGSSDYIVLIDGKPSPVKGSDALKQINAASIKQIEVITNPSAKYDAEGQAGIINVIRKKEALQGLSGSLNTSLGTTDKYTANGLINYRTGKVNVFGGIDFADNKYRNDLTLNNISYLETGTQILSESAYQTYNNDNLSGRAGIDYDMNDKNSFSLSGSYGKQGFDQGTNATYNNRYGSPEISYYNSSSNYLDVTGDVLSLNADYQHKFGENHTLSVTNYYFSWDGRDENNLNELITNENYDETGVKSKLNYVKDNHNFQYRLNVDYKRPINSGTLETGVQYRYEYRFEDMLFRNYNVESDEWVTNDDFTYKLDYYNSIYSGYATYSGTVAGIGYMAGLRSEYFTREITFSNDPLAYNFNKFMLYPSLHFSKTFKDKHQFQASYSRRINRPQPWLLNKTPNFIDPYNIFIGSPYLEPEYTDAFELNYRFMQKIVTVSVQTYLRNTSNSLNTSRTLREDGIMVHELINADNQQSYGVELGLDFNLAKWWQLSTGGNIYHYTIATVIDNSRTDRSTNSWDARMINNFSLKWGTKLQTVLYVQGAGIDASGNSGSFYVVNLAVNQPFMKGKANIGLSAQNLFDSIKFHYTSTNKNYDNDYLIRAEGPVIMLTASYSFNNFQNKQRGRADDSSFKGGGAF